MSTPLKGCPFCGEAADAPCGGDRWCVVCNCGVSSGWFETEAEMAEAWNTRTPTPPAGEVERLRGALEAVVRYWETNIDGSEYELALRVEEQVRAALSAPAPGRGDGG